MEKEQLPEWIGEILLDEQVRIEIKQMIQEVEAEDKVINDLIEQAANIGRRLEDITFAINYKQWYSDAVKELNRRHTIIIEYQKEIRQLKNEKSI